LVAITLLSRFFKQKTDSSPLCTTRTQLDELGRIVLNYCNIVPDGVILFFPSYAYEQFVFDHWTRHGTLQTLSKKKQVSNNNQQQPQLKLTLSPTTTITQQIFREPRDTSRIDETLLAYSKSIEGNFPGNLSQTPGALLSCVMGGKMSEGVNFQDGLARLVMVIGMPYPAPDDPLVVEKMKWMEERNLSGLEWLQQVAWRSINQSIGRSIRHAKDYAAIVLVDGRFAREGVQHHLPKWISSSYVKPNHFGESVALLGKFFAKKREQQVEIEMKRKKAKTKKTFITT
jgi:chromosome transmission fidelity protein 1